ncbi:NAD(P)/FAD-dependent oxidoreductase [Paenibacillus thiaminolyticus]|uniref:NAD(P)/FAD-dependent oxidoreductase n=1 Tax=Paenibacillus thiaminolyticus TaxID=49283 RepID=A0AAP9J3X7_PANTH|nr:NAD(P)/FAD-dependent oxidoreductase [Paenibacillus thiaminolyticus]MCY9534412.1 NAD(P)/FAD-dependent oxidoreductase [Paenibacillus thiaminolyticus]MCY9602940.1 NAD(P)/FAD-dependent oxidoreductase [Paenibacillus thiaminolyticus]MCY9608354.1 NAD(P)/FAD-dependent oxidoreductase [Paenibacillus thiaminolyticus]MCY9616401.1 NAD(P)/FAD-dependent oxidoreductase [Paenibacillus thiaminolyticus]MCY9621226.1 NAD(P)/FAD-dependent oxidoreductase [Paenibacillus thiaminolyticus]
MKETDIIVIGGGPSGLMACIAAAGEGADVLLIDKGDKLGRKLGISGGGRCNVTNNKDLDELIRHIPGNGRFLHSAFSHFNNQDIIRFFEGLGIALKEEDNGRMFPVSDKAKTVVEALIGEVRTRGVTMMTNRPVAEVLYADGAVQGVRLSDGAVIRAKAVIVATGGKSVPRTGSTGDGYPWAEAAGHTITELYPTEVPLTSQAYFIREKLLQGLSLQNIRLAVWNAKGKKIIQHDGDLLFTHFGLSGPAALRCSQFVVKERKRSGQETVLLTINMKPELSPEELERQLMDRWSQEPKKAIKNMLRHLVPERMVPILLQQAGIEESVTCDHIRKQPLQELCRLITSFPVKVNGTLSLEEAFVTGGGVNLKEIDPRTMESRLMRGLFFCGEILDVHGYTGGYNITAAFATGYTAGKHAAALP